MANIELDPPQPPTYHIPSSSCPLHPLDIFSTFCPSCLRDRLASLESPSPSTTTHRNSTSSNLFIPTGGPHDSDLRRCKSFSFARCGAGGNAAVPFEPQRNSCDVRRRVIIANNEIDEMAKPALEEDMINPKGLKSLWTKLQKWRRKKHNPNPKKAKQQESEKPDPKSSSRRRFRETQSEVAVDAFGRRSCDFDPRFSLDAGRVSFEDSRYSFDEPRASWVPPMLTLVEDSPTRIPVQRFDGQIPVEDDATIPGGSAQTRDYYCSDSLSRSRRRSLDRSSSVRRSSFEMGEVKPTVANGKVSPGGDGDSQFLFGEWSSASLRDDRSESFSSANRDGSRKLDSSNKKSKGWGKGWNLWGLIHRKNSNSSNSGSTRENVVGRSVSVHWPNGYANGRLLRSNSNASLRSLSYNNGGFGSTRKATNGVEKKSKDEFVLERNRSARHSSGHVHNGMSRFYATTAMNGSRRESGKNISNSGSSHLFSRSIHG